MYGMLQENTRVSEKASQPSVPNLVNLCSASTLVHICLKKIGSSDIEQFQKKFPNLPLELDNIVKEDIISGLIFPLSKITDITLEKHDTHFSNWPDPDCLTLKNRLLMLHYNLNGQLRVIPKHIRTKYFDLETKVEITEKMFTQTKEEQNKNKDKDRLWNVTKENDALVLRFKNATIATKTIALNKQSQILFWDNKTISVLQKKKNHIFLLFFDLSPLTTLAVTLTNLQNYKQALLLKTIIEKSKQGHFFDLTDPDYKSIYEAMPPEIKAIIATLRTKK